MEIEFIINYHKDTNKKISSEDEIFIFILHLILC